MLSLIFSYARLSHCCGIPVYEISFVLSRSNVLTHCEQYEVESLRADLEKSNSDLADAQNLLSSKVEAGKAEQELIEKALAAEKEALTSSVAPHFLARSDHCVRRDHFQ